MLKSFGCLWYHPWSMKLQVEVNDSNIVEKATPNSKWWHGDPDVKGDPNDTLTRWPNDPVPCLMLMMQRRWATSGSWVCARATTSTARRRTWSSSSRLECVSTWNASRPRNRGRNRPSTASCSGTPALCILYIDRLGLCLKADVTGADSKWYCVLSSRASHWINTTKAHKSGSQTVTVGYSSVLHISLTYLRIHSRMFELLGDQLLVLLMNAGCWYISVVVVRGV